MDLTDGQPVNPTAAVAAASEATAKFAETFTQWRCKMFFSTSRFSVGVKHNLQRLGLLLMDIG